MNDMYQYNVSSGIWSRISGMVRGQVPSPRYGHGFTSSGGMFYVFGGYGSSGAYLCRGSKAKYTFLYIPFYVHQLSKCE